MKISKTLVGILLLVIFQIILSTNVSRSKTHHTKTKVKRNKEDKKQKTNKRKAKRQGGAVPMATGAGGAGINPFAPTGIKGDDNDPDKEEMSKYVGRANPKYGQPVILMSGYMPNKYPKCLVENRLAKFNNNDDTNQRKLKKCTIRHVLYSIDLDKLKLKKCIGLFKRSYPPHNKAYGYILSTLLKYAKNFDDNVMSAQFKICGNDFVEELRAKARQYESNFRIAISLFADIDDLFTYPPKPPLGFSFTKKKKLRKMMKLKKIKKRRLL